MASLSDTEIVAAARAWHASDPDGETRAELARLLDPAPDLPALRDRFGTRLAFGTAGLRGELGAGPNRMNRVLVAQAASGVARFLTRRSPSGQSSIVIGHDARKNSAIFAQDTARIMAGHGIRAFLFSGNVPTPVVAFAVRHLKADAGIVVTASHNPARDNGYKVYLGGQDAGSQIVSPTDTEIARLIDEIASTMTFATIPASDSYEEAPSSILEAYLARAVSLVPKPTNPLKTVYTPLHGVGLSTFLSAFTRAGFPAPSVVPEQAEPDPTFPTVAFPNPEEPGALDLAMALADKQDAELVIANDPDADRLAIAVPSAMGWRKLSGDEIGLLLAAHLATLKQGVFACSVVSSTALSHLCSHRGLKFESTPTGFKFISRVENLAFGYEEALGFCVDPDAVRDKDGISAALVFASMCSDLKARGISVLERLHQLYAEIGFFATSQISVRLAIPLIPKMVSRIVESPPDSITGRTCTSEYLAAPIGALQLSMPDGRILIRPSGTEPKVKLYLECRGKSEEDAKKGLKALEDGTRTWVDGLRKQLEG